MLFAVSIVPHQGGCINGGTWRPDSQALTSRASGPSRLLADDDMTEHPGILQSRVHTSYRSCGATRGRHAHARVLRRVSGGVEACMYSDASHRRTSLGHHRDTAVSCRIAVVRSRRASSSFPSSEGR